MRQESVTARISASNLSRLVTRCDEEGSTNPHGDQWRQILVLMTQVQSHTGSGKELGGDEGPPCTRDVCPRSPHVRTPMHSISTCPHTCMVVTGVTHKAALRIALRRFRLPLGGPAYWCLRAVHVLVPLQGILSLPL